MSQADDVLKIARAHFDNMRGKKIKIPEWGVSKAKPFIAFFDPPTLRVRQEIKKRSGNSEARQIAVTAILCLKDAEGKKIFTDDAPTLDTLETQVCADVVARLSSQVLGLTRGTDLGN
ncbi:MAG: hypothetical protein ACI8Q6_003595 [Granulosicoccus sp.]|jgi:hypothetical protein